VSWYIWPESQRKGNVRPWRPLPNNGSEDVTSINPDINPKGIYSYSVSRDMIVLSTNRFSKWSFPSMAKGLYFSFNK
jgi:hypothetical protein